MDIYQNHSGSGDNVAGDKVVHERKLFSETQTIRLLPPSLGGNDVLSIDSIATLKTHSHGSATSITLLLDVVPTHLPDNSSDVVKTEGRQEYTHSKEAEYVFDSIKNKRHDIDIAGRVFTVSLLKISVLDVPNVSSAIEYLFGISERDMNSAGGKGGNAIAFGLSSTAIGGRGGGGGAYGKGGDGGNAEAYGDGVFAMGGEGGGAGQKDRGGKGGRGPLHVLMEDYPEKYKEISEAFGITEEEARTIGKGGDGGSAPV